MLSFFLVALGVSYPVGTLVQGRIADTIGVGWTTVASALTLSLATAAVAVFRPRFRRALVGREPPPASAEPPEPVPPPGDDVQVAR